MTVTVKIENTGTVALAGVVPSLVTELGEGRADKAGAPVPPGVMLGPGDTATFTMSFRASQPGLVAFRVTASGSQASVWAAPVDSDSVTIRPVPESIIVYPNPFRPDQAVGGTVKFNGLDFGDRLTIYTVRGLRVWEGTAQGPLMEWDGRNEGDRRVAAGTYLWVADRARKKRERGTVIVE